MPALPSWLDFLGHFVPFLAITMAIALRLNPSLINDSFKSVNSSCYCLQNCLQVFSVFVLMECEKCTQDSRCGVAHHICCRRAQAQDAAPRSGSSSSPDLLGASCHRDHLHPSLVSLDIPFRGRALPLIVWVSSHSVPHAPFIHAFL